MAPRANAADVKVIALGLGRTGTTSLREALIMLGFGPCYSMLQCLTDRGKDWDTWFRIGDGNGTPEDWDSILRGYGAIHGYASAMYAEELYAAYPDAKFILTTRKPDGWAKSMESTIVSPSFLTKTDDQDECWQKFVDWLNIYLVQGYHGGRLRLHAQEEFLAHNERVKQIIPPEKLLVHEVGEGWDRLVEFLEVPKPTVPYPHANASNQFHGIFAEPEKYINGTEIPEPSWKDAVKSL